MTKLRTMQNAVEQELLLYGVDVNSPEGSGDRKVSVDHLRSLIGGNVKLPRPITFVPMDIVSYYSSGDLTLAVSRIVKDAAGGAIIIGGYGPSGYLESTPELIELLAAANKLSIPVYSQIHPMLSVLDTRAAIDSAVATNVHGVWIAATSVTTGNNDYNRAKTNDIKSYCKNIGTRCALYSPHWWCFAYDDVSELPDLPEFQPGQPYYQQLALHNSIGQPMVRDDSDILMIPYELTTAHLIDDTVKIDTALQLFFTADETSEEQSKHGLLVTMLLGHEYVVRIQSPQGIEPAEYIPPTNYIQLGQLNGQPIHYVTSEKDSGNYTGRVTASIGQYTFDTGIPGTTPVSIVGPYDLFVEEQISKKLGNFKVGSSEDFVLLTEDANGDLLDWESNVVTTITWNKKYFVSTTGNNPISLILPVPEKSDYWVDIEDINGTFVTEPLTILNNTGQVINGQPIDLDLDEAYLIYTFRLTEGSGIRMSGR